MSAVEYLPPRKTLRSLSRAVQTCRGCELYKHATQAVFGEGPVDAALVLIGEQPGNEEDLQGHPFVGPAGRVLTEALEAAGLHREDVFVTNAVKHFKWEPQGKRRLHKKPSARELGACRPWLDAELELVHPAGIVCLGATAAQAMLGRDFRVQKSHGQIVPHDGEAWIMATWHPSAVLRAPEQTQRHQMRAELVADFTAAAKALRELKS
jgi:uracil-DNA glycosylase family protein